MKILKTLLLLNTLLWAVTPVAMILLIVGGKDKKE